MVIILMVLATVVTTVTAGAVKKKKLSKRQEDPADVEKTMAAMKEAGDTPYIIGQIEAGEKGVTLC